ncbi:RNA polymerase sigma factor [Dermatophilaceae bacterium Soc4.6]
MTVLTSKPRLSENLLACDGHASGPVCDDRRLPSAPPTRVQHHLSTGEVQVPPQVPTEEVLVRDAALGDTDAFSLIAAQHGAGMFRYALRMLDGDLHDAEDAVQEALIDAWVNLPKFRGESALGTWLFRLTANRVLASRRRRRPVPVDHYLLSTTPDEGHRGPGAQVQHGELWETLDLALTELPWRQRASWLLREVEGLSYDDIANILETTPTVVRGQLHRARRSLAIRMEQWR